MMLNVSAVRPRLRPDTPAFRAESPDPPEHIFSSISPASSTVPLLSNSIGANSASEASSVTAVESLDARMPAPSWAKRQARGAWIGCFTYGATHGGLKARMPELKDTLGLDDRTLGLALGAAAIAQLPGTWSAGPLSGAVGAKSAQALIALSLPLSVAALAASSSFIESLPILLLIGATSAIDENLSNAAAGIAESHGVTSAVSAAHGFASLGALVGGGVAAAAVHGRLPLLNHLLTAGLAVALMGLWGAQQVRDEPEPYEPMERDVEANLALRAQAAPPLAQPRSVVRSSFALRLTAISFSASLAEAALYDWTSIYLRDALGADATTAAAGYVCVVGTMAATRLLISPMLSPFSSRAVLTAALSLASLSMALALGCRGPSLTLVGLAGAGAGIGLVAPRLSREMGERFGNERHAAMALLATGRSGGFFVGPPLIGLVANRFGLARALLVAPALSAASGALCVAKFPERAGFRPVAASDASGISDASERTLAHQSGAD